GREPQQRCCNAIVARNAPPVRVHPAEVELRLRLAVSRRLAIQTRRPDLVFRHALAVLVSQGLCDQARYGLAPWRDATLLRGHGPGGKREAHRRQSSNAERRSKSGAKRAKRPK